MIYYICDIKNKKVIGIIKSDYKFNCYGSINSFRVISECDVIKKFKKNIFSRFGKNYYFTNKIQKFLNKGVREYEFNH